MAKTGAKTVAEYEVAAARKLFACLEPDKIDRVTGGLGWSRLSEQNLRIDKWSVCRG
jgi:hypothetical protein